jgi:hypothetical protein
VASVALWCGQNWQGFSDVAGKTGCGGGASVRCGAGQGWRRIRDSMPCVNMCWAELNRVQVHGNERHALRALACSLASGWHGRAALHGRFRPGLAQGIDPVGQGGSGSKVTAWAVVDGALSMLGCPRWPW